MCYSAASFSNPALKSCARTSAPALERCRLTLPQMCGLTFLFSAQFRLLELEIARAKLFPFPSIGGRGNAGELEMAVRHFLSDGPAFKLLLHGVDRMMLARLRRALT